MSSLTLRLMRQHWDRSGGRRPVEDVDVIARLYKHQDHPSAASMHGRCTTCGMTWEQQGRAWVLVHGTANTNLTPEEQRDNWIERASEAQDEADTAIMEDIERQDERA